MTLRIPLLALTVVFLTVGQAAAHDGEKHAPKPSPTLAAKPPALPFDVKVGGPFKLVDHDGRPRTDRDFRGRFMLIFFGYANCESICPVGLRRMTAALDRLGPAGAQVQPLLISVDAAHDTPETMRDEVVKIHPRLLGLTGTDAQLKAARKAYQVESKEVSKTKDGKPVYAHGSFVYLMAPDGTLATIIPPVLGDAQMAGILQRYVN